MHTNSGCTHILFFYCGILRKMYSSPSAVPYVFNTAHAVKWPALVALPSQLLLELNSSTSVFLLLSPVVIFLYLCNLSGLNSNPCVLFGRYNPPDADICCSNDIIVVYLRSDLQRWGSVDQGAPAWQFVLSSSQTAPFIQQLLIITSAVAVLTKNTLHLVLWETGSSYKPNTFSFYITARDLFPNHR